MKVVKTNLTVKQKLDKKIFLSFSTRSSLETHFVDGKMYKHYFRSFTSLTVRTFLHKVPFCSMFSRVANISSKFGVSSHTTNLAKPASEIMRAGLPNQSLGFQRNFRLAAGHIKSPVAKQQPSVTNNDIQKVQSDLTGKHKIIVVGSCKDQKQCHKRTCDTTHDTVCPHKPGSLELVQELAGNLTHKIPKGKSGVELDKIDATGQEKPQFIVIEKTTVPVEPKTFKEHEVQTEFVQREYIAAKIVQNLPVNSVINLKKTSQLDTPDDHET